MEMDVIILVNAYNNKDEEVDNSNLGMRIDLLPIIIQLYNFPLNGRM